MPINYESARLFNACILLNLSMNLLHYFSFACENLDEDELMMMIDTKISKLNPCMCVTRVDY